MVVDYIEKIFSVTITLMQSDHILHQICHSESVQRPNTKMKLIRLMSRNHEK